MEIHEERERELVIEPARTYRKEFENITFLHFFLRGVMQIFAVTL